jgi:hypothetical protein
MFLGGRLMFKLIFTIKKKTGLSRAEFIEYYETKHAPLVRRLFPPAAEYRRNYIMTEGPAVDVVFKGLATDPVYGGDKLQDALVSDFDVITEVLFDDLEQLKANVGAMEDPEIFRQIRNDEPNLFEPGGTKFYIVEERGDLPGPRS